MPAEIRDTPFLEKFLGRLEKSSRLRFLRTSAERREVRRVTLSFQKAGGGDGISCLLKSEIYLFRRNFWEVKEHFFSKRVPEKKGGTF